MSLDQTYGQSWWEDLRIVFQGPRKVPSCQLSSCYWQSLDHKLESHSVEEDKLCSTQACTFQALLPYLPPMPFSPSSSTESVYSLSGTGSFRPSAQRSGGLVLPFQLEGPQMAF